MPVIARYEQQPADFKDWDVEYIDWLASDPMDTLDAADAVVKLRSGTSIEDLVVERVELTRDTAKLWVRGGTAGCTYRIELTVTTQRGRIDQCEIDFKIKDA